jgi:hypothetical protein
VDKEHLLIGDLGVLLVRFRCRASSLMGKAPYNLPLIMLYFKEPDVQNESFSMEN